MLKEVLKMLKQIRSSNANACLHFQGMTSQNLETCSWRRSENQKRSQVQHMNGDANGLTHQEK